VSGQSGTANFYKDKTTGTILAYARCGTDSRNMSGISYQACPTAADKTAIETMIETACSGSAPTVGQVAPHGSAKPNGSEGSGSSSSTPPFVAPTLRENVTPENPPVNLIEPITSSPEPTAPDPPAPPAPEPIVELITEVGPTPEEEEGELFFSS
jgi:hypothetical protein